MKTKIDKENCNERRKKLCPINGQLNFKEFERNNSIGLEKQIFIFVFSSKRNLKNINIFTKLCTA